MVVVILVFNFIAKGIIKLCRQVKVLERTIFLGTAGIPVVVAGQRIRVLCITHIPSTGGGAISQQVVEGFRIEYSCECCPGVFYLGFDRFTACEQSMWSKRSQG